MPKEKGTDAFDKLLKEHPERLDAYDAQTDASRSSEYLDATVRADLERLKGEKKGEEKSA